MPTYQYKGHEFSADRELSPDEWKQTLAHLDSLGEVQPQVEKEKTNPLEDMGAGLRDVGKSIANAMGAAASTLTTGERRDEIIGDVQRLRKENQDQEATVDRGEGGKVFKALGAIPAYLNPVTAGMAIAGGATETGLRMLDDGSDTGHALAAMGADAGLNMATMGAAQKIGVAGRMANGVLQGGTNVAQEALLNHPVQNAIRSDAGVQALPDMTPGDYAAAYIPGHVMGHMLPSKGKAPTEVPLDETGVPTRESLDASFVARTEGLVNSIDKQIYKISEQMDSLVNGPKEGMSEKQRDFWLSLSDKRDALLKEKTDHQAILDKYKNGESPVSQEEQIRQLNLDFIDETNKSRIGLDKPLTLEQAENESPAEMYKRLSESQSKEPLQTEDDFHQILLDEQQRVKNTLPTGEAFRSDVTVANDLFSSDGAGRKILGQNRDGKLYINPEEAKRLFDSLSPEQQAAFGSPRGLQLFAEIHEATHNVVKQKEGESVKDYEGRMNNLIAAEWRAQGLHEGEPGTRRMPRKLLNSFQDRVAERAQKEEPTAPVDKAPPIFEKGSEVTLEDLSRRDAQEAEANKSSFDFGEKTPFEKEVEQKTDSAEKISRALEVNNVIDTTNMRSSAELLQDPHLSTADPSSKISREIFGMGQFVEGIKREAPIVWEVFKRIKSAYDTEIALKREWWAGNASNVEHKGFGPFMTLKHYENPNTLAEVVPRLSANDKIVVSEFMVDNANKKQRHDKQDLSGFSDIQKKTIELLQKLYDTIQTTTGTRRVNGYIHAVRKGDFAVGLKTSLGDVTHIESFPTKEIAERWAKKAQELGHATTELIDFNTERGAVLAESFGIVRDILENSHERGTKRHDWTMETLDAIQQGMVENATIGKHNIRRMGFSGFEGNRLMKTRKQNGEDFFKSLESYINEAAVQHKKTLINRSMVDFWENDSGRALQEKFPNQYDTSKYLTDIAMNNQKKYKVAEAIDQVREGVDSLFSKVVSKIDSARGKEDRFYYPDVPVVDKTMGMFAQLFYISALTSRIGFTAGQVLTAPFAGRQFLKEGSLLDTMLASGKGLGTIMSGGDAGFKSFMKEVANTTDSMHPQFKNEINEFPIFDSKSNKTLSKAFGWATGQTVAGIGDSVSRYMTAATAYHFYKDMGMTGDKLKSNVVNAVDNTMVMYDRTHTSPFLNRLGLVGQAIAPLQKYGLASLGNLVGDLKLIGQSKGGIEKIRAMAPVISTMLTTMIMAGSIGLPLLTEYETIRLAFIHVAKSLGWNDVEDSIPKSVMESMLTHKNIFAQFSAGLYKAVGTSEEFANDAATHGVLSAGTGLDISSSLRFNPVIPGEGNQQQASILSLFPVIKSALDVAVVALVKSKKLTGADTTDAEQRAADLKFQVFPGQRYLIDKFRYDSDNRQMVPGGNRGYGQVEQTGMEQLGQALGSSTISTSKSRAMIQAEEANDKNKIANSQKAIDMIIDGLDTGNQNRTERGYELAQKEEMTAKQIKDQIKAAIHQRSISREDARILNQKGQVKSYMQRFKAGRMEEYK